MCGILGIINAAPRKSTHPKTRRTTAYFKDADDFMKQGLIASSVRGVDSTGIFQIDSNDKPFLHKLPIMSSLFVEDKYSSGFFRDAPSSPLTVGHVRAATAGKVSDRNAHPFEISRDDDTCIIGVHNGTLRDWGKDEDAAYFDVDSEWALHRIASDGVAALGKKVKGAYSFVWWDSADPGKVFFARNKERPLWLSRTPDKRHIIFGSEPGMLSWIAERNGIALENAMWQTGENQVYVIDYNNETLDIQCEGEKYVDEETDAVVHSSKWKGGSYYGSGAGSSGRGDDSFWYSREGGRRGRLWEDMDRVILTYEMATSSTTGLAPVEVESIIISQSDDDAPVDAMVKPPTNEPALSDWLWPVDAWEMKDPASPEDYFPEHVTAGEEKNAAYYGLSGQLVVFHSRGMSDAASVIGTVKAYPNVTGRAAESSSLVGARAELMKTHDHSELPIATGSMCVAVVAGLRRDESAGKVEEVFVLSPLRKASHGKYRDAIISYLANVPEYTHMVPKYAHS